MNENERQMTPDEFTEQMWIISNIHNTEESHYKADQLMVRLLRSLGYDTGAAMFDNMRKYYE